MSSGEAARGVSTAGYNQEHFIEGAIRVDDGKHVQYFEGVRTRTNKLRSRWQARAGAGPADGTTECAS
jgi:hypothetical protein